MKPSLTGDNQIYAGEARQAHAEECDEDGYTAEVVYRAGEYTYDKDKIDTRYPVVEARISGPRRRRLRSRRRREGW